MFFFVNIWLGFDTRICDLYWDRTLSTYTCYILKLELHKQLPLKKKSLANVNINKSHYYTWHNKQIRVLWVIRLMLKYHINALYINMYVLRRNHSTRKFRNSLITSHSHSSKWVIIANRRHRETFFFLRFRLRLWSGVNKPIKSNSVWVLNV